MLSILESSSQIASFIETVPSIPIQCDYSLLCISIVMCFSPMLFKCPMTLAINFNLSLSGFYIPEGDRYPFKFHIFFLPHT